jgi:hypothetical protein
MHDSLSLVEQRSYSRMPQRQRVNTFLVHIPAMQLNTMREFQIHTSVFASSSLLTEIFMRVGFHAFSVSRSFTSSFRESVICITGLLPFALPCWLFLFATGCYIQHEGLISSLFQSNHYHNKHLKFMGPSIVKSILPSITNKMWCYTIFFIAVSALHVSGGFSAHHQELKFRNCTHSIWYVLSLLAATTSVGELELMMGGKTARNM